MLVNLYGGPTIYTKQGRLQFSATKIEQRGTEGALLKAFLELKAKLEKEGLFDISRKRPIPDFPRLIGVVTSASGAAFQDILRVTGQRYPLSAIVLAPSLVQGDQAAAQIAKQLERLGLLPDSERPDVIIVGRGGGSAQDLQPFNEEIVARAIFASQIPVISAVGHETDTSIADLVADRSAATPSHAAEMAVPDQNALYGGIQGVTESMSSNVSQFLKATRQSVRHITDSYEFNKPVNRVRETQQWLEELTEQLNSRISVRLLSWRHASEKLSGQLSALDPGRGLRQGLVRVEHMGLPVQNGAKLSIGDRVQLHFADTKRDAIID